MAASFRRPDIVVASPNDECPDALPANGKKLLPADFRSVTRRPSLQQAKKLGKRLHRRKRWWRWWTSFAVDRREPPMLPPQESRCVVSTDAATAPRGTLLALPEDVLARVLARVPVDSHGRLRCVSRRTLSVVTSRRFRTERLSSGYAESLMVVAGGQSERMRCSGEVSACELTTRKGVKRSLSRRLRMNLPTGRRAASVVTAADETVLFLGGFLADGLPTATGVSLSPLGTRFEAIPSMRVARAGHACGRFNDGRIVVAGGLAPSTNSAGTREDGGVCASVEVFDGRRWTTAPSMPRSTCFCASGVLTARGKNYFVVAGGEDGRDVLDHCQAFDGQNWTLFAPMPAASCATAGCAYNNALYVFGGYRHSVADKVLVYDIENDAWSNGPALHCRFSFASACPAPGGKGILVVAGSTVLLLKGTRGNEVVTTLISSSSSPQPPPATRASSSSSKDEHEKNAASTSNDDLCTAFLAKVFKPQASVSLLTI